jgi:hypothetical protein
VRGVTPTLLFGIDANRNGVCDSDEQVRSGLGIETSGSLGWAAYLTVHGAEASKRRDGSPAIKLNQDDLELLYEELKTTGGDDLFLSFIVAYRIAGVASTTANMMGRVTSAGSGATSGSSPSGRSPSSGGNASSNNSNSSNKNNNNSSNSSNNNSNNENSNSIARPGSITATPLTPAQPGGTNTNNNSNNPQQPPKEWTSDVLSSMDLTGGGGTKLNQVLDLIDAQVQVNGQTYLSPFKNDPVLMATYMPLLMDAMTTQDAAVIPGRLNWNECAAELLYGIPLLDADTVAAILDARGETSDDPNRLYETWPLVEGIITLEQMRQLSPLVCAGGDVFRAQIIGYYENRGASSRAEVIIDATTVNPKLIGYRDLTHLGRGFDLSVLGLRSAAPTTN